MGAWGTGTFDNDTACDWAYGLDEVNDLSLVKRTLESVLDAGASFSTRIRPARLWRPAKFSRG